MKATTLSCAVLLAVASARTATAIELEPESQDIVVITTPLTISAGSSDVSATALAIPLSKRFVIRGIYMYKNGGVAGASITRISVGTTASGRQAYWASLALPDTGAPYPAAAMSTMFYVESGSLVNISASRTGDTSDSQNMQVAISGYYVSGKAAE